MLSVKPILSNGKLGRGRDTMSNSGGRRGSAALSLSLSSSWKTPRRVGVRICEEANDILEISTRTDRAARGDLALFYSDDFVPDPMIECSQCNYEAESDLEAGGFRIFNLPDGGWQLLCKNCEPPDPSWEFDRFVAVADSLLPAELLQVVFLYLNSRDMQACALVCRDWSEFSWTVLTIKDNPCLLPWLTDVARFRNVWVLRVLLHDSTRPDACVMQLCDYLHQIDALSELQVTGITSDGTVKRLAQALRFHRTLQVLDLSRCRFRYEALTALLSALEENDADFVRLSLPRCCVDTAHHKYPTIAAAQKALAALMAGTPIIASLV
eukprot:TRINITY_DN6047_c0_g1_i1.p1 TRINITY_DN6047_c0_g1~~TRINITY_DN6047_c0_g1_i1.p1  ORF type:complete len:374 (+),score=68.83 TRINITY_DN6047_c0_g1_i1:150-1124(+)